MRKTLHVNEPLVSDPWPESDDTRTARSDKKQVSFCPPVAASKVQDMFGDNPDCVASIAEDASTLSEVANLHRCTHTCVKYAKKGIDGKVLPGAECRFGYGDEGKPILPRGCVTNGNIRVYSDGTVELNGVQVASEGSHDQRPAAVLRAEILRAAESRRKAASQDGSPVRRRRQPRR